MHTSFAFFLVTLLTALTAAAPPIPAPRTLFGVEHPEFRPLADEIEALPGHEWAGYYKGGSQAGRAQLWLAPRGGAVFNVTTGSILAPTLHRAEIAAVDEDLVLLGLPLPQDEREEVIAAEMIRLRWSGRHYLVSRSQMPRFCRAVRLGWAHELDTHFLLRPAERELPLSGLPTVPEEWGHLLPTARMCARVIDMRMEPADPGKNRLFPELVVTLDVGAAHGVEAGHRLERVSGRGSAEVHLTAVGERVSEFRVVVYPWEGQDPWPRIGCEYGSLFYPEPVLPNEGVNSPAHTMLREPRGS